MRPLIMRLLGQVILLFAVCYGLDEQDVPEYLRKNFDENKVILPVSQDFGEEFYANATTKAFSAVLRSLAKERMDMLSTPNRLKIEQCFSTSNSFSEEAKCFVALMESLRRIKKRSRHKVLRRIEIRISRRKTSIDQKMLLRKRKETAPKRRFVRSIMTKESYHLLSEKSDSIVTRLSHHLRKTAALLKGEESLPLRGWRSLAKELIYHRDRNEKQNRLSTMLTSGSKVHPSPENYPSQHSDPTQTEEGKRLQKLNTFLAQGVKLVAAATGHVVGNKTIRLLSPRVGNTKHAVHEISLLSPDIPLSMDSNNDNPERNALLELLLEVSGATAGMRKALSRIKSETPQMSKDDVEKTIGKRERQKIEVIEMMEKTYSDDQMESFKKRGFAFMTDRQRRLVYGPESPYYNQKFVRRTEGLRKDQLERKFINTIRLQAVGKSDYNRRMKYDLISSPTVGALFVNAPITNLNSIFSPVVLSVFVSSPTLIGPLILSPWLFSALITSPWALCPIILSPFAFVPIILSPVALSPFVLSPGIFSPAILSPLLMVPYILSPGVFNPIILSPLVLSPMVLSPLAASPVILSPALLSPLVLSPMYHTAFVLSPSLLSPPIASDGENAAIILSPDLGML